MARNFNGSSDKISYGTGGGVGPSGPWSAAAWINVPSTGSSYGVVSKRDGFAVGTNQFDLETVAGGQLAITRDTEFAITSATFSAGVWQHLGAACDASSYKMFINGVDGGNSSNSGGSFQSGTLTNQTLRIGWVGDSGGSKFIAGSLANVALWNAKLSPEEMYALSMGALPLLVRPESLVHFAPLDGYGHPALDYGPYRLVPVVTGTTFTPGPSKLVDPSPKLFLSRGPITAGSVNLSANHTIPNFIQNATLAVAVNLGASQSIPSFIDNETLAAVVKAAVDQAIPAFVSSETLQAIVTAHAAQTIPDFTSAAHIGQIPDNVAVDQIIPAFADTEALAALIQLNIAQQIPGFGTSATDTVTVKLLQNSAIPAFAQAAHVSRNKVARTFAFVII